MTLGDEVGDSLVSLYGQALIVADMNVSMRRIDLTSKLVAPLFISIVDVFSRNVALWVVLGSSLVSVMIEYVAIAQVCSSVYSGYAELKRLARSIDLITREPSNQRLDFAAGQGTPISESRFNARHILTWFQEALSPWAQYMRSPVVPASLSLCMLYLTVLSFNAQMITYLLDSGFTALWVSGFRLVSVLFELGATWAAPVLMSKIGPIRSGLWFITWEFICAAAGVAVFAQEAFSQHIRASVLITSVLLSRIGLWGFDLSIQYLVQEEPLVWPIFATRRTYERVEVTYFTSQDA
ncbi:MAG: hypothetical protein Q9194_006592 [Teloschistes cf. exilis]